MLNRVILMGRLTADPERRQTQGGVSVAHFSVACERSFADRDGNRACDFFNVAAWRGTAEFVCSYFKKGRILALEGSLQTRSYEDKSGNKRTAVEIVADQVYFADSKPEGEQAAPAPGFPADDFEEIDGGLPF